MSKFLPTSAAAVVLLWLAPVYSVYAQPYYSVYTQATASPDDGSWSVPSVSPLTLTEDQRNMSTALAVDTQLHQAQVYVPSLGHTVLAEARASSFASLDKGELKLFVGADGVDFSRTASASAYASFADYMHFDLPEGMTQSLATLKLTVDGNYALNDVYWQTEEALATLVFGTSYDTKHIYRGWDGLLNTLPLELSVSALVSEGALYRVNAVLSAVIRVKEVYSYIDLEQTGTLSIEVSPGVRYSSFSTVLLTIPEPATVIPLTVGTFVATLRKRRHQANRDCNLL